ncbi:titin-like [Teleopsis dalmanni]|uniref:titin-like n=1 Tax=Teleopsis dalmanni TaxID=139649 RepID=UPI0018CFB95C|nr:titin-like [Teleopsis dalmanni]
MPLQERRISAYQLRTIDSVEETSSSGKEDSSPESPEQQQQQQPPQYGQYLDLNGQAPHQGRSRTKKTKIRSKSLQPQSNIVPWRKSSRPRRGRSLDKSPFLPGFKPEPVKSWTEEPISLKPAAIEKKVIPKMEAAKIVLKSIKSERDHGLMSIGATLDKIIAGKSEKEAIPWITMRDKLKKVESVQHQLDEFDLDEVYLRPLEQPIETEPQEPKQAKIEQTKRDKEIQRLKSMESIEIMEMTEQMNKLITQHQKEETIPWKEMRQHLKSVERVHKQIEKFKIEEVELRHLKAEEIVLQETSTTTEDMVIMQIDDTSKGSIEKVLRREDLLKYDDALNVNKQQFITTEDINMLNVAEREKIEAQRLIREQQAINWRQNRIAPKLQSMQSVQDTVGMDNIIREEQNVERQQFVSIEDRKMMHMQQHEHLKTVTQKTHDEQAMNWRHPRHPQQYQQLDESTILSVQEREDLNDEQLVQPTPVLWERGKTKPQKPEFAQPESQKPVTEYQDIPKTYEEVHDELTETVYQQPKEQPMPVMWERGKKQVIAQEINDIQEVKTQVEQVVEETKKVATRRVIQPEPEQKMEQVVLKPIPRQKPKPVQKEEEVIIKPAKTIIAAQSEETQPTKAYEEAIDTLEEQTPSKIENIAPVMWERGKKKPIIVKETVEEKPAKVFEEEVDILPEQLPVAEKEDLQPVLWQRGQKKVQKPTKEDITEVPVNTYEEAFDELIEEPVQQKPEEPTPVMWERGKKTSVKLEKTEKIESTNAEQLIEVQQKKVTRKIIPHEPEQKMEQVVLKPIPRQKRVEAPKPEEVELKPAEKPKPVKEIEEIKPTKSYEEEIDELTEEVLQKPQNDLQPILWERGKKKPIEQKVEEIEQDEEQEAVLNIQEENIVKEDEILKIKKVKKSKKKHVGENLEKYDETEATSTIEEMQQVDEVKEIPTKTYEEAIDELNEEPEVEKPEPIMWKRGKKITKPKKEEEVAEIPVEEPIKEVIEVPQKTFEEVTDELSEEPVIEKPEPVMWKRGKKVTKPKKELDVSPEVPLDVPVEEPIEEIIETPQKSHEEVIDELKDEPAVEKPEPVLWKRGKKKVPTREEVPVSEIQEIEETPEIIEQNEEQISEEIVLDKARKTKKVKIPKKQPVDKKDETVVEVLDESVNDVVMDEEVNQQIVEKPPKPEKKTIVPLEPETVEKVVLKPVPRKQLPKAEAEKIEEVSLKPVKKTIIESDTPQPEQVEESEIVEDNIKQEKVTTRRKKKKQKPKSEKQELEEEVLDELSEDEPKEISEISEEEELVIPTPKIEEETVSDSVDVTEKPKVIQKPLKKPMPIEEKLEEVTLKPVKRPIKQIPQEEIIEEVRLKPVKHVTPVPEEQKLEEVILQHVEKLEEQVTVEEKKKVKKVKKPKPEELPEIPDAEPVELEKAEHIDLERKPIEEEETPKMPYKREEKPKPIEEKVEEKQWPTGRRKPLPEEQPEEVTLKPIPAKPKEEKPKETPPISVPKLTPEEKMPSEEKELEIQPPIISDEKPKERSKKEKKKKPKLQKASPSVEEISEEIAEPFAEPIAEEDQVEEIPIDELKEVAISEEIQPEEEVISSEVLPTTKQKALKKRTKRLKEVSFEEQPHLLESAVAEEDEIIKEDVSEEISQKTITLKKTEDTRPQFITTEQLIELDVEDIRRDIEMKVTSNIVKKEKRRIVIDDSQPLPELELITQKRVQEGIDKVPDEDLIEDQILQNKEETTSSEVIQEKKVVKKKKKEIKPPRITEKLRPRQCIPEEPTVLECKVEGVPFPEINWYFNDMLLFASEKYEISVVEHVAKLKIAKVTPTDVGVYTCEARNEAGVATTRTNLVLDKEQGIAPQFSKPLKIEFTEEKQPEQLKVTVTCQVTGLPKPAVKWYRGIEEVLPSETVQMFYNEETGDIALEIINPTPNEAVTYSVQAQNQYGRAIGNANILSRVDEPLKEILKAPTVTPLSALVVPHGGTLLFEATYTGSPKPEIKWMRNGREITVNEDVTIETTETTTIIKIINMTRKRTGKYEVCAKNKIGEAKASGSVVVTDQAPNKEIKPPRFIQPLQPKYFGENEVAILEAIVESEPLSSFQWFVHTEPIKSSTECRIVSQANKSTLLIKNFEKKFVGPYTCRAENVGGSVTSTATVNLLEESPQEEAVEFESPRFIEELIQPVCVMDGEALLLTCKVIGKPIPKVEWYHNNEKIIETKETTIAQDNDGNCELQITEVFPENDGEYKCVATNKIGETLTKTTVNIQAFEYIPDSEITGLTASEEDILDKTLSIDEQPPKIIKKLPEKIEPKEGELAKLEVKVIGKPKPKVKWLRDDEEIFASEEYQIENFDDGTSVLVINHVYPDDVGTISFEAYNPLGVAVTTALFAVEGIVGSKDYRKPEWVTHMEEMQKALKETTATITSTNVEQQSHVLQVQKQQVQLQEQFAQKQITQEVEYDVLKKDKKQKKKKQLQIQQKQVQEQQILIEDQHIMLTKQVEQTVKENIPKEDLETFTDELIEKIPDTIPTLETLDIHLHSKDIVETSELGIVAQLSTESRQSVQAQKEIVAVKNVATQEMLETLDIESTLKLSKQIPSETCDLVSTEKKMKSIETEEINVEHSIKDITSSPLPFNVTAIESINEQKSIIVAHQRPMEAIDRIETTKPVEKYASAEVIPLHPQEQTLIITAEIPKELQKDNIANMIESTVSDFTELKNFVVEETISNETVADHVVNKLPTKLKITSNLVPTEASIEISEVETQFPSEPLAVKTPLKHTETAISDIIDNHAYSSQEVYAIDEANALPDQLTPKPIQAITDVVQELIPIQVTEEILGESQPIEKIIKPISTVQASDTLVLLESLVTQIPDTQIQLQEKMPDIHEDKKYASMDLREHNYLITSETKVEEINPEHLQLKDVLKFKANKINQITPFLTQEVSETHMEDHVDSLLNNQLVKPQSIQEVLSTPNTVSITSQMVPLDTAAQFNQETPQSQNIKRTLSNVQTVANISETQFQDKEQNLDFKTPLSVSANSEIIEQITCIVKENQPLELLNQLNFVEKPNIQEADQVTIFTDLKAPNISEVNTESSTKPITAEDMNLLTANRVVSSIPTSVKTENVILESNNLVELFTKPDEKTIKPFIDDIIIPLERVEVQLAETEKTIKDTPEIKEEINLLPTSSTHRSLQGTTYLPLDTVSHIPFQPTPSKVFAEIDISSQSGTEIFYQKPLDNTFLLKPTTMPETQKVSTELEVSIPIEVMTPVCNEKEDIIATEQLQLKEVTILNQNPLAVANTNIEQLVDSVSDIKLHKEIEQNASFNVNPILPTICDEVIPLDAVNKYDCKITPSNKMPTVELMESSHALEVLSIVPNETEDKIFLQQKEQGKVELRINDTTHKSLLVNKVDIHDTVDKLESPQFVQQHGKAITSTLDQISVQQTNVFEKENTIQILERPQEQSAELQISDLGKGAVVINEKNIFEIEQELHVSTIKESHVNLSNTDLLKVPVVEQINDEQNLDKIEKFKFTDAIASSICDNLFGTIITETQAFEELNTPKQTINKFELPVDSTIVTNEHSTIDTINTILEKTDSFNTKPLSNAWVQQKIIPDLKNVAVHDETSILDNTAKLAQLVSNSLIAKTSSTKIPHTLHITSETQTFENVDAAPVDVLLQSHQANIDHELKHVHTTLENQAVELEKAFTSPEHTLFTATETANAPKFGIPLLQETNIEEPTNIVPEFEVKKFITKPFMEGQQHEVITSEIQLIEELEKLTAKEYITTKAKSDIVDTFKPSHEENVTNILMKEENINPFKPNSETAKIFSEGLFQETLVTDVIPYGNLDIIKPLPLLENKGNISFSENVKQAHIQNEIITLQKENLFKEITPNKFAKPIIDGTQHGMNTTEITSLEYATNINDDFTLEAKEAQSGVQDVVKQVQTVGVQLFLDKESNLILENTPSHKVKLNVEHTNVDKTISQVTAYENIKELNTIEEIKKQQASIKKDITSNQAKLISNEPVYIKEELITPQEMLNVKAVSSHEKHEAIVNEERLSLYAITENYNLTQRQELHANLAPNTTEKTVAISEIYAIENTDSLKENDINTIALKASITDNELKSVESSYIQSFEAVQEVEDSKSYEGINVKSYCVLSEHKAPTIETVLSVPSLDYVESPIVKEKTIKATTELSENYIVTEATMFEGVKTLQTPDEILQKVNIELEDTVLAAVTNEILPSGNIEKMESSKPLKQTALINTTSHSTSIQEEILLGDTTDNFSSQHFPQIHSATLSVTAHNAVDSNEIRAYENTNKHISNENCQLTTLEPTQALEYGDMKTPTHFIQETIESTDTVKLLKTNKNYAASNYEPKISRSETETITLESEKPLLDSELQTKNKQINEDALERNITLQQITLPFDKETFLKPATIPTLHNASEFLQETVITQVSVEEKQDSTPISKHMVKLVSDTTQTHTSEHKPHNQTQINTKECENKIPEERNKDLEHIKEIPEEVRIIESIAEDGKPKKKTIRTRVIKKVKGDKQEVTKIETVQEDDKQPETTVTVEEIPAEEERPEQIQEVPEEVRVIESIAEDGKPKKKTIRTRVIKKVKGDKQEVTKIETVQEDDKQPETTVTVEESPAEKEKPEQIQEVPEEVRIIESIAEDGKPKKKTIRTRVIKKVKGGKQEVTKIETVQEDDKQPETTVTVEQSPAEEEQPEQIQEVPEEVRVIESIAEDGKPKKKTIRTRVIKKVKGDKQEVTKIETVQEDDKQPETTVTVEETPAEEEKPEQIQEVPEEVRVIESIAEDGKPKKKTIRTRVIKKVKGGKQEVTKIETVQEDDKQPETTVTVEEIPAEEELPEQIQEVPEEVRVIESIAEDGKPKKKTIRTRVIKKVKGDKQEVTKIETVQEDDKQPETTVTVEESPVEEEKPEQIQEVPEEVRVIESIAEDGKPKKKTIRIRVIKKVKGDKQEVTKIETVQEDDKQPETTVTVEESPAEEEKPEQIQEVPEEVRIIESIAEDGKPKKKTIRTRVIKKVKGDKQEVTKIETVQEDDKQPETTVTVEESPAEEEKPEQIQEVPEEVRIIESIAEDGKPKKKTIRTRVIKKVKGDKQEVTKIETVQEDDKQPETTVTVEESPAEEEKPEQIQEVPEEVRVIESIAEDGKPKKKTIRTRVIKKVKGDKQEVTKIETVQEDDKQPETTVTVEEIPAEEEKPEQIQEVPEEVRVIESIAEDGKPKKKTIRTRVIKKVKGDKQEVTKIETVQEDDKQPETTVTVEESPAEEEKPEQIQEVPEEVRVIESIAEDGKPKKKTIRTRVIKKVKGDKQEVTKIETVQEDDKQPETTVTVEESPAEEEKPEQIQEVPEEVRVIESIAEDGKPKKKTIRTRVIKKVKGGKQEVTKIETVQEDDKQPETTVTVEESPAEKEKPEQIQEVPEEVRIIESIAEDGKPKKKTIRTRVIKKVKGGKQEVTKIETVQEDDKQPETTVTVEQSPAEEEQPEQIQEVPEEVRVIESIAEDGKPKKKTIRTRVIKKVKGDKQEVTKIETVQEDDKQPETTVTVEETPAEEEKPEQIQEVPEEVRVIESIAEDGKPKKKTIRTRVIKKVKGGKQEVTKIETVQEDDKQPETTVTVEEIPAEEELPEQIQEVPEEVRVIESIAEDGKPKKRTIRTRVIKKVKGGKQEVTKIETVQEDDKQPETTVTVEQSPAEEEKPEQIQEVPEEVRVIESIAEDGKPKKKTIRTRVIKKVKGDKQEVTKIETVQEDDKQPETTVTVEETPAEEEKPEQIQEVPEEVRVIESIAEDGKPKKKTIRTRVIKKVKGDKQEVTKIETVQEDDKQPETTVTVEEIPVEEELPEQIQEVPEEVRVIESIAEDGTPKKKTNRTRVIKKVKGDKQEVTKIETVQEDDKQPETTVTVEESPVEEEKPEQIQEVPEEVRIIESIAEDGTPKKKTIRTRVIKKVKGDKQEVTKIETVQEDDKQPETTVTVEESPVEEEKPEQIQEVPEEVRVIESIAEDGKPKKKTIRTRVIKKVKGDKQEVTKIETIQEDDKQPETTVTVEEIPAEEEQPEQIQEVPEEVRVIESIAEDGKPKKKTIRTRVIKKVKGDKQEVTKIETVQEDDKQPETTVTVEEIPAEEGNETNTTRKDGTPKKKTIRTRVIKKVKGDKQEVTKIETVQEDDKQPETTVTVEEIPAEEEKPEQIQEVPEEVRVIESIAEDGTPKKKTIRTRVIKKVKGDKQEVTKIETVQEDDKQPETTVTVKESPAEEDKPEQIQEVPEEVRVIESIAEDGKNGDLSNERPRLGRDDLRHGTILDCGCRDLLRIFVFFVRERP